jgi:ABC-type cobalamin/Fe3+-siderophores transport system ATPase subunit
LFSIKKANIGYDKHPLIVDVQLTFEKGKVYCLWGRNGSGKTTFLRTIAGFIDPLEGEVLIRQSEVAMVNQFRPSVPNLTVSEYLTFGVDHKLEQDYFDIQEWLDKPVAHLSDGQFKLVAITRQMLKDKPILILDEPTAFLDIYAKQKLAEVIKEIKKNKVVVIVSHDAQFIKKIGDELLELKDRSFIQAQPDQL